MSRCHRSIPLALAFAVLSAVAPSATATDFLTAADPVVTTDEDVAVPLGLSVARRSLRRRRPAGHRRDGRPVPRRFGGRDTRRLAHTGENLELSVVTGYCDAEPRHERATTTTDDDYQLLNVRIDLVTNTSSGRVAHLVDGKLATLDQFRLDRGSPRAVRAERSDEGHGLFRPGRSIRPSLSPPGNSRSSRRTLWRPPTFVEHMTADDDSTNFLGAGNTVQDTGVTRSTLAVPAELEPASGKRGFIVLNATSAAARQQLLGGAQGVRAARDRSRVGHGVRGDRRSARGERGEHRDLRLRGLPPSSTFATTAHRPSTCSRARRA